MRRWPTSTAKCNSPNPAWLSACFRVVPVMLAAVRRNNKRSEGRQYEQSVTSDHHDVAILVHRDGLRLDVTRYLLHDRPIRRDDLHPMVITIHVYPAVASMRDDVAPARVDGDTPREAHLVRC